LLLMFGASTLACFRAPPVFAVARPRQASGGAGSPLFRFQILIFHIPRTRDVIRRAACVVKRKDSRMVNMPENSEGLGRGGDLLSMRKPRDGRKALWHGHNVRKEEGKTGMYGDCPRPGFPGFLSPIRRGILLKGSPPQMRRGGATRAGGGADTRGGPDKRPAAAAKTAPASTSRGEQKRR
jgi:hypothetical protein